MVIAQVGVGQHIVADLLRGAQAAAVADHQPRLGPQHGEVVADRLGVGRADADVDERYPAPVRRDEVIGGHLVAPPCGVRHALAGILRRLGQVQPACARKRGIFPGAELPRRPVDEFVDIAVVVGEEDVALEVLGRGAGVMRQPRKAEIGAQAIEQRKGEGAIAHVVFPVRDFVADVGKLRARKVPREFLRPHAAHLRAERAIQHIGKRDFLPRDGGFRCHVEALHDDRQLLGKVIGKQRGPRHRAGIGAFLREAAEGMPGRLGARLPGEMDAQFRIAIAAVMPARWRRQRAIGGKGHDIRAQPRNRGGVDARKRVEHCGDVVHRAKRNRLVCRWEVRAPHASG